MAQSTPKFTGMKNPLMSLTGRLVRNLDLIRTERQLTAERFAALTGVSRNTLNLWRRGKHVARLDVVERAADALGLPDAAALLGKDAGAVLNHDRGGE